MKELVLILIGLFALVGLSYGHLKEADSNDRLGSARSSSAIGGAAADSENLSNKEIADEIKKTEKTIKKLESNVEKTIQVNDRSPYYGKINLSGISGLKQNDPSKEYFTLSTKLKKNETVRITGWVLKSEVTGNYVTIGKASLLPFPFTNTESDIVLQAGDRAYLIKGFSPIGISFRTNKCTGYFEENRAFTPRLSLSCPRVGDEDLPEFSPILDRQEECVKIIERIPRCTTKGSEFLRDLPDTVSNACKTYIKERINYNTCVANHFGDTDFPGNEYRVYFKIFGPLWRTTHDKINLLDESGLVVDTIEY